MANRDGDSYELGADIQRLLAHSRRVNAKLDTINKQIDLIRRNQTTDEQLVPLLMHLDRLVSQVKRTVNPKE